MVLIINKETFEKNLNQDQDSAPHFCPAPLSTITLSVTYKRNTVINAKTTLIVGMSGMDPTADILNYSFYTQSNRLLYQIFAIKMVSRHFALYLPST